MPRIGQDGTCKHGHARRGRAVTRLLAFGAVFACSVGLGSTASAQAAPGDLDLSFSGDGSQTTDFGGDDRASGVALQPDGKIVAVGASAVDGPSAEDFVLARYNTDGSLDMTFSGDGRQTTEFAGARGSARDVALQADGKIIVVGTSSDPDPDADGFVFAVARYNPDGSLDTTFSGDGRQTTELVDLFAGGQAAAVAIQPDGKIVAVGHETGGGSSGGDFAVVRYNTDGSLDASFSADGIQITDTSGEGFAGDVAVQPNGRIVVVGSIGFGSGLLVRYNADGSLDPSFSGDGTQPTSFAGRSVALQSDGKLVLAGGSTDFIVARHNPDGSLDASFSDDGTQAISFAGNDSASGVVLQPGGRIVAVGQSDGEFALARYNPDGALDTSFSDDGKQTTQVGGAASDVNLQADGKIVVVGGGGETGSSDFVVVRYEGDPAMAGPGDPPGGDGQPGGDIQPPINGPRPLPEVVVVPPAVTSLVPAFAAKLEIARASVSRAQRRLSVLAPITGRASGEVRAAFQAAGRTERFDAEVDAGNRRVRIDRQIPAAQARLGTGILTLTYGGDANTQPQEVRLRAASQPAGLDAERPRISNGRLTATGEITRRARGVVRLQLLFEPAGQQTRTLEFTAPIRDGKYRFNEALPADVLAGIAQRRGVVHSYTLFTGFFERRVRGEMSSFQVLGNR